MESLLPAALLVGIAGLGAWFWGRLLIGARWALPHPALQVAAEAAIGLLLLSHVLFAASYGGYLLGLPLVGSGLFGAVMLGLVAGAFGALRTLAGARAQILAALPRGPAALALLAGGVLYAVWILLGAALPVTALDELVYHLEVPRQVLDVGYLPVFTDNVYAYFPLGSQMLFMLGLGLVGETAARLFHALHGILILAAIYGYARTMLDRSGAVTAAVLFATVPWVMVIGSWAYIDLNFTLYAFLALVATLRYVEVRDAGEQQALPWAVLAGLMAGGAWTVKYTGLQLVLLLALVVLVAALRSGTRRLPWGLAALGAVAAVMFAPYLVRTWSITGWPLFPLQAGPFELTGRVNWSVEQAELLMTWLLQYGAGSERTLLERLMASIRVYTSAQPNYTAYDGIIGPVFLLAPLALLARRRAPQIPLLFVFAVGFTLYWSLTTTQVRFLLPVLPVMAVLVAIGLSDRHRVLARGAVALFVSISLFEAWDAVVGVASPGRYWAGSESRVEYVERRIPTYSIYAAANATLGPGDRLYLINMRAWGYLLDLPGRGELEPFPNGWRADYTFGHFNLEKALIDARSPADVDEFFGARGITHLMVDEGVTFGATGLQEREKRVLVDYFRRRAELLQRNPKNPAQSLWRLRLPEEDAAP
jgi:hypothetical protein